MLKIFFCFVVLEADKFYYIEVLVIVKAFFEDLCYNFRSCESVQVVEDFRM